MNERIKELAELAGFNLGRFDVGSASLLPRRIERFAELVRQDEREQAEKQEPKAWIYEGNLHIFDPTDWAIEPESVQPLYTAPSKREWIGLTEDESDDIYNAHHNTYGECITSAYDLVLDIEAKLRERNT